MTTLSHLRWLAALMFLVISSVVGLAHATSSHPKRVALIVANASYRNAPSLNNPASDARLIADASRKAGFDRVILGSNLTQNQFLLKLKEFQTAAAGAEMAMVYFAGHGIEVDGRNWLIPVDASIDNPKQMVFEAVELSQALDSITGAKTRIVVLDACRNNPFASQWRSVTRSIQNGLSGVEVDDMLVLYSAAPGQVASDGIGSNSPFAASLARRMQEVGLPLQLLGGAVRDDVLKATNGAQRPFVSASMTGTPIYLLPPSVGGIASSNTSRMSPAELEDLAWKSVVTSNSLDAAETYLRDYPNGRFASYARAMIRSRASVNVGKAQPITATAPSPLKSSYNALASTSILYTASYPSSGEPRPSGTFSPPMSADFGVVKAKAAVQPVPMTAPTGWILPDDYPAEALLRRAQGRARFNLLIRPEGSVSQCEIVGSTGSPLLDKATCDLIAERVRFIPAKTKSGKPVEGVYSSHLNWALPSAGNQD